MKKPTPAQGTRQDFHLGYRHQIEELEDFFQKKSRRPRTGSVISLGDFERHPCPCKNA
jgi:hypothetical protein